MNFLECNDLFITQDITKFTAKCDEGNYELRFHANSEHDFYLDLQTIDYYAERITNFSLCKKLFKCSKWEIAKDG